MTFAFFTEHGWATWDRLRASQATSLEIVLGKALPRVATGVVQLAVLLSAGVLVFGLHIRGNALALAPLMIAFCVCLVLLGVCVTALCRTAQQANSFAYLGMVLFGAIGGAFVPFNLLPARAGPSPRSLPDGGSRPLPFGFCALGPPRGGGGRGRHGLGGPGGDTPV